MALKTTKVKDTAEQATATVGIDIGFGFTKVVYGEKIIIFPSLAGHAHEIKFGEEEIDQKYPGQKLFEEDGAWLVGDYALKQIPPKQLLSLQGRTGQDDEYGMEFRVRLLKAALAILFPMRNGDTIHITLATGLPVEHMRDAEKMKQAFQRQLAIKTNNADFVANIVKCIVMPQPMGTIYHQTISSRGIVGDFKYTRVAVVDVGRYTIDCTLDDDGQFIDAQSDSVETGVYTAEERIAATLSGLYNDKIKWEDINTVLRTGRLRAFGVSEDYSHQVEDALKPLRDATVTLMNRLWGTGYDIDVIYLAGGGAELVFDIVRKMYPQAVVVTDPQMSNSIGYYNYAVWKQVKALETSKQ